MVAGAPATRGVGPHASLLDAVENRLGLAGLLASGDLEAQPVVGGVFGGELGDAVPFGVAEAA